MKLLEMGAGLAVALLLAACNTAAPKAQPSASAADAGVVASSAQPATGTVRGRGYVILPTGDMVTCARLKVLAVGPNAPKDRGVQRDATCNSQGYFEFTDLPAGVWNLKTIALWRIRDTDTAQGIQLWEDGVRVEAGQETNATVARILCCSRDASNVGWVEFFTVDLKTGKVGGSPW
ncbi:carboxypeptidase-like regulatory domain-containing protein [Inquilinus sp. NPDC058860]|uniref:carboxypeptidase-like regulatory domain-containing protein n=1 Tax=Inquilinus sp. NPDC058860 TaxID=3346652 RepID=UPI003674CA7C